MAGHTAASTLSVARPSHYAVLNFHRTQYLSSCSREFLFFFFNDTATTEIYTFPTRRSSDLVRRQQDYITAIVSRFKDVPFLMWDLINEPSFDKTAHLWVTRANGDRFESQRWNEYLGKVHGTNTAVSNAWNMTTLPSPMSVPDEPDFAPG